MLLPCVFCLSSRAPFDVPASINGFTEKIFTKGVTHNSEKLGEAADDDDVHSVVVIPMTALIKIVLLTVVWQYDDCDHGVDEDDDEC